MSNSLIITHYIHTNVVHKSLAIIAQKKKKIASLESKSIPYPVSWPDTVHIKAGHDH